MKNRLLILNLEDSVLDSELIEARLNEEGLDSSLVRVEDKPDFISALERPDFDLILADYSLPAFDGLAALKIALEKRPDLPFIFVSGAIGEDFAIETLKQGATDYVLKSRMARLAPAVKRALLEKEERKERERIERERLQLAAAIEATADSIVLTDTEWKIIYVNPSFERITKFSRQDILGQNFNLVWDEKQTGEIFGPIKDLAKKGVSWSGRIKNRRKDGTLYQADTTISAVKGPSGEIVNYIAVERDITEKVRFESIAQAVNISENIGHFCSAMRHEIGNPINSVKMALAVLKEKLPGIETEEAMKLIKRMENDLARTEFVLQSLKGYNLFESLELKKVEISGLIKYVVSLTRPDLSQKGITLETKLEPGERFVLVDGRALQHVLLNVIANAVDACAGKSDAHITIQVIETDSQILLRARDNGSGISPEDFKYLFMPFFTTKPGGTGLGLSIVKKLLSKMNSAIEISSEKGLGTTIDIFLPKAE